MKKIVLIVFIFLTSCMASKNKKPEPYSGRAFQLNFLYNYRTKVDSLHKTQIIYYDKLNLKEERVGKSFKFFLKDGLVFEGDESKYQYLFEVFNDSSLLISYVYGKSGAAGPDLFERDSVVVLNVNTKAKAFASLDKIYLTRSKDVLFRLYKCSINTLESKIGQNRFCSIDSIDMENNKIFLTNQCRQAEKFDMISRQ